MSFVSNTVLAFSMSADAFAASIGKGVALRKPSVGYALKIGALFGGIEAMTPLIGWVIGLAASRYIASIDHWVAFTILGLIGLKMIHESFACNEAEEKSETHKVGLLVLTAIGTSIDSMAVGVTLALLNADILVIAGMIGFATFLMVTIGIMAGHYLGCRAGKIGEVLAGVCLIVIGSKILLEHLGYL